LVFRALHVFQYQTKYVSIHNEKQLTNTCS